MDVQKTGRLIAQARKERELTQRELAERLHVSDRAVSKWERGLNLPEAALFEPLCQALGITVTELLRGERAEASVPVLEQAVDEAVALAGAQERGKKRYWRVILVLLALLAAAGVLIGRPMWEDYQRQRYYARDNVVPSVWIAFFGARTNGEFYPYWGGHHAPLNSDCSMSNADLRIWFPPESTTIRNMPCIRPEELEVARAVLGLSFDKPGLEVELVRWPESAVGTQVTLEEAERVELQEMETYSVWWWPEGWQPERYPVAYRFEIEAGYLYSVVFRWGDGWYLEHPFRAVK